MDNKLTIRNMTQDQAGWYQCLASDGSNRALSRKTKLNLVCKFSPALFFELLCTMVRFKSYLSGT